MRQAIDTPRGRALYSRRMATMEPVFANLRYNKRLDRFTLRSQAKVNTQWHLYCLGSQYRKAGKERIRGLRNAKRAEANCLYLPETGSLRQTGGMIKKSTELLAEIPEVCANSRRKGIFLQPR
ncbi:transposase [Pseudoduganella sp. R-34]|uniref:transposase n=1 Tax=unclassified Pseudoduganella TaxID=2637179 RepID=UPI003CF634D8